MEPIIAILVVAALLNAPVASGQATSQPLRAASSTKSLAAEPPKLTKFDLDFPGGTPKELLKAIENALGQPVNAIVPDEYPDVKLPALKMQRVDLPQLFQALAAASTAHSTYIELPGRGPGLVGRRIYGFRTASGIESEDAIWAFFVDERGSPKQPKVCRFYQLGPYLADYNIDDITTALQTGWEMLGEREPPAIRFHKDTKLLIAVGEQDKLALIDSVLQQLSPVRTLASGLPSVPTRPATKPPQTTQP
ncbi:MAG: hypothetical protein HYY24_03015 [Verrucomicrobia bacterium]|nr:hypothetical protein [Verrucomicrobiota bacterium]